MTLTPHPDETPGTDSAAVATVTLEERARVLARPLANDSEVGDLVLLGLTIAGRTYAIEAGHVREVLPQAEISRLPWAPPAIAGVMNVRGKIVPVADIGLLLGVGQTAVRGPVVILDGMDYVLGLRVDSVDDITTIAARTLVTPEGEAARVAGDLVLGLTPSAVVLDARALCTDPRLTNHH